VCERLDSVEARKDVTGVDLVFIVLVGDVFHFEVKENGSRSVD
jgi:hypothetical protein